MSTIHTLIDRTVGVILLASSCTVGYWGYLQAQDNEHRTQQLLSSAGVAVKNDSEVMQQVDANEKDLPKIAHAIFGEPPKKEKEVKVTPEIPITKLNMKLQAVFFSTHAGDSAAVVQTNNNQSKLLRVGDTLSGGVAIRDIKPTHITLERGGKLENLPLIKGEGGDSRVSQRHYSGYPSRPPITPSGISSPDKRRDEIRRRLEALRAQFN
ncbi:type II secretion system protein N [Zooshikella sp. RANM57]|uniref:type II secretion system protein N n=1 Tax=Zooshikella sp. RANM57 TaxID=3425863 RepID=UPI003D6FC387